MHAGYALAPQNVIGNAGSAVHGLDMIAIMGVFRLRRHDLNA